MNATFAKLMDEETGRVRARKLPIKTWHEGYGLLAEEVDEFFDEVKKKTDMRDRKNALKELVQVAALCQRIAIDLSLVDEHERTEAEASKSKIDRSFVDLDLYYKTKVDAPAC
jgi:NTP pyrophosphatase (non-canonical NTP hydrolase)